MKRKNKLLLTGAGVVTLSLLLFIAIPTVKFDADYSFVLTDRDGELMDASISEKGEWKLPPMGPIPDKLKKAIVLFEDKRFWSHPGIDPAALARALLQNAKAGEIRSGASTITMQLARIGFAARKRTLWQKFVEALAAVKLEILHSKTWILREFCSQAPFGGNVVGIEAASWRYFGKMTRDLSWAEAAMLAVLPNAPSLIHLSRNRDLLLAKRNALLVRMEAKNYFDKASLELAIAEPLPGEYFLMPHLAPWLADSLQSGKFGEKPGFLVKSSLQIGMQQHALQIVRSHLAELGANGVSNAVLLIADNTDSRILAYVGNAPQELNAQGGWVDIIQKPRSTGSTLKPFLYAAMLDSGELLPDMLIADIPTHYSGFSPENNTRTYRGAIPAYQALARSLNVPAVRLLEEYSVDRFYSLLKKLGMRTLFREAKDYGLALIIGGAEGSLWDLAGMYSGLARNARGLPEPFHGLSVYVEGTDLFADNRPSFSQAGAYLTLDALIRATRPASRENWEELQSSRKIAWKTGTSQGYRDAWAIGVSRDYTVAVWVGNADGTPSPVLGGVLAAAPIMFDAFDMLPDSTWIEEPFYDMKTVTVCAKSGYPPGPFCGETKDVRVPKISQLPEPCPYCKIVHLDSKGRRTFASLEGSDQVKNVSWFVLPPAMEYYYRQWNPGYLPLPPSKEAAKLDNTTRPLYIVYPEAESGIFVPRDLDGKAKGFIAEAIHRDASAKLFWHLDTMFLGTTEGIHQMLLNPPPGKHILTIVDMDGETVSAEFNVLQKE